jgi:hypothetical protein
MTTPAGPVRAPCANPIDAAVLMDYWLAALPAPEEEAVETHLFTCDACGDRLREMTALADGLTGLARTGALRVVVGDAFVRHATESGQRVREYAAMPGGSVQCTIAADDDYLVARLGADLHGAARVDLSFSTPDGVELGRMADIPVSGDTGAVVYQESTAFAKASPTMTMIMRLLAVDGEGTERLLGEYAFHHTRTIPGPPGW